jgi:hypothetical protein
MKSQSVSEPINVFLQKKIFLLPLFHSFISHAMTTMYIFSKLFKKVARARLGERTRDLLISFIFSFHHLTAEPQRLPNQN